MQITSNYPRELRCVQKRKKKPTFSFTPMEHQIYKTRFRNFMNCNYLDHAGVEFVKMQIWNPVKYWYGYSWWKIQRRDSLFEFSYGKWLEFTRVKLLIFYRVFVSFFSRVFIIAFVVVIENNYTIFWIKTNIYRWNKLLLIIIIITKVREYSTVLIFQLFIIVIRLLNFWIYIYFFLYNKVQKFLGPN